MAASYLERDDEPAGDLRAVRARAAAAAATGCSSRGSGRRCGWSSEMRFGDAELRYLERLGFRAPLLRLPRAVPLQRRASTRCPRARSRSPASRCVRVTAPRVEGQLLETLLLNQINFQTTIATKAARIVLAAGGGEAGAGERVVDFSPRRDHGVDAAMKVARAAAIAGRRAAPRTSPRRCATGCAPVGTMAHSYVMSFGDERAAFRAFMEDTPDNTILLVDTYDTLAGVRNAIAAARETGLAAGRRAARLGRPALAVARGPAAARRGRHASGPRSSPAATSRSTRSRGSSRPARRSTRGASAPSSARAATRPRSAASTSWSPTPCVSAPSGARCASARRRRRRSRAPSRSSAATAAASWPAT